MEDKYKNCDTQDQCDLVDLGFTICENFSCGEAFMYTSDFYPKFCSSKCFEEYN